MIAPESASYPVLGAALATGMPYDVGLRWVEANRRWGQFLDRADDCGVMAELEAHIRAIANAYVDMEEATSVTTAAAFRERINAAMAEGRIYWPWPMPAASDESDPLPGRIEEGGDTWDGEAFVPMEGVE